MLEDKQKYEKIFPNWKYSSSDWWHHKRMLGNSRHGDIEVPHDILEKKNVKKIHLRLWNKRTNKKELLAEVISTIDVGSFAIGKDTFWLPANQITQAKLLEGNTWDSKGVSVNNRFWFYAKVLDDKSLETTVRLEHNFSAQKEYGGVETELSVSGSNGCVYLLVWGFKIISKHNQYKIIEDELLQEYIQKNKYIYSGKELACFGLKNLNLDMFEVGTIEIEVVK